MNWLVGATGLITPVGILGGVTVLALTIVDGAAFLGLKTRGALRGEMRDFGVRAAVGYLGVAISTLGAIYVTEPGLRSSFRSPLIVALVILTATLTGIYIVALHSNRYYATFAATAALVFGLVGLVAALLFSFVDRTAGLTIREAIISTLPLNLMSIMASVLLPIVLVYFDVLYSAFSGPVDTEESYG